MGFLDRLRGGGGDDAAAPGEDAAAAPREPTADEREALQAQREQDVERVAGGGIPLAAEQRIAQLAGGAGAFTSTLSVSDFALAHRAGVRPICQVMGSSVYHVGWQNYPWGRWGSGSITELRQLSDAWNAARRLALGRLEQEARLAGCHAVVDVAFRTSGHEFLRGDVEVVVAGTAVHLPEGGERPVLTDLSLPDYALLRDGGYRPVGVVASTSVFYVVAGWQTRFQQRSWVNQELGDFTQGIYAARETAIARATEQARRLGAGGMIGVAVDHQVQTREVDQGNDSTREDLIVTFHILGTAIASGAEHRHLDPTFILRQGATTT